MKLTARQALELCQELWEWLRDNPSDDVIDKGRWPKWKELGDMLNRCPLCEYQRSSKNCNRCLIYWRRKPGLYNHCTRRDSPFYKWVYAITLRSKKYWAGRIVKLCKEALEVLDEKEEYTAGS